MGTNHAKHETLALTPNLNITACTCKFLSTGFVTDRVKLEETEPFLNLDFPSHQANKK